MGQAGLEPGEAGVFRLPQPNPQPSKGSPCRPQSAHGKPACPECGSQRIYKDGLRLPAGVRRLLIKALREKDPQRAVELFLAARLIYIAQAGWKTQGNDRKD